MVILYQFSIFLYTQLLRIASLFNPKAKQWIEGRKNTFAYLDENLSSSDELIWFHCASLGEFEQGKPLMERLKKKQPHYKILVTFFSPSGYELRKNTDFADYVCYLPVDTKNNATQFIHKIQPKKVFFIKYEFWNFYLQELKQQQIPTYLISGVFRSSQLFFKPYGCFHRKMLSCFTHFFLQNATSEKLLHQINIENTTVSGDTRIDNVFENSLNPKKIPLIEKFTTNKKTIVLGSSWQNEEEIISNYISSTNKAFKYIIAPHDISKAHIKKIESLLKNNYVLYSNATLENVQNFNILIIDNIGILASVYQYTDIAFVGGGFSGSLHNILEPASFGNAILFGPKHKKFHEAAELISVKGAFSIDSLDDFIAIVNHLSIENQLEQTCNASKKYIEDGIGVTDKIWKIISKQD